MAEAVPRPRQIVTFVGRFGRLRERAVDSALVAGPAVADCCPAGAGRRPGAGSHDHRGAAVSVGDRLAEG